MKAKAQSHTWWGWKRYVEICTCLVPKHNCGLAIIKMSVHIGFTKEPGLTLQDHTIPTSLAGDQHKSYGNRLTLRNMQSTRYLWKGLCVHRQGTHLLSPSTSCSAHWNFRLVIIHPTPRYSPYRNFVIKKIIRRPRIAKPRALRSSESAFCGDVEVCIGTEGVHLGFRAVLGKGTGI